MHVHGVPEITRALEPLVPVEYLLLSPEDNSESNIDESLQLTEHYRTSGRLFGSVRKLAAGTLITLNIHTETPDFPEEHSVIKLHQPGLPPFRKASDEAVTVSGVERGVSGKSIAAKAIHNLLNKADIVAQGENV